MSTGIRSSQPGMRSQHRSSSSSHYRPTTSSRYSNSRHSISSRGPRAQGVLDDGTSLVGSGVASSRASSRASGKSRQSETSSSTSQLLEESSRAMRALKAGGASTGPTPSSSSNTSFKTRKRPENFLDDLVDSTLSYEQRKLSVQQTIESIRNQYGPVVKRILIECQHFLSRRGFATSSSNQRQTYMVLGILLFVWTCALSIGKINDMSDQQIDLSQTQMNQPYNLRHHKALYQGLLQQQTQMNPVLDSTAIKKEAKALDVENQNRISVQTETTITGASATESKRIQESNNEKWAKTAVLSREENNEKQTKTQQNPRDKVLPLSEKDDTSKIVNTQKLTKEKVLTKGDQKNMQGDNGVTKDSFIPTGDSQKDGKKETTKQSTEKDEKGKEEPDINLGVAPWRPRERHESKQPPPNAKWIHPRHNPLTKKEYAKHFNAPAKTIED